MTAEEMEYGTMLLLACLVRHRMVLRHSLFCACETDTTMWVGDGALPAGGLPWLSLKRDDG